MSLDPDKSIATAFDPDAYLAAKAHFDPDAYLASKTEPPGMASRALTGAMEGMGTAGIPGALAGAAEGAFPGATEAFGRGAVQGATLGFGDEIGAGVNAAISPLTGLSDKPKFMDRYRELRDAARKDNARAAEGHGIATAAGEIAGGAPAALAATGAKVPSLLRLLAAGTGMGAATGLGSSEADLTRGDVAGAAKDTGIGAAGGAASVLIPAVAGKVAGKVGDVARRRFGAAAFKAGEKAATEIGESIASARGQLGAETQKGSRQVENLMRLDPAMTPPQQAEYRALHQSGVVPDLQQSVAGSTLEALPDQSARIADRATALADLIRNAPGMLRDRTAELSKSSFGKDAASLAKSYAEPLIAAYAADKAGSAMGLSDDQRHAADAVAGLIFSRTRAGKALSLRVNRPGNQMAIWGAIEGGANKSNAVADMLRRIGPAVAASVNKGDR